MAIQLTKPVRRELLATNRGRQIIIELVPGDEISFRIKGKKTRYSVSLHKVFNLALMQFLIEDHKEKLERYEIKKKYSYKKVCRPKYPNLNMFNRQYIIALK